MRKNFSFFARPYFWGAEEEGTGLYIHRGTSLIRGEQIASYLGGKYNPTSNFENDICIYVKPRNLDRVKDGDHVDVSDGGDALVEMLKARPKVKVITSSDVSYEYVKTELKNKMFLIYEHNCNFENIKRDRKAVVVAGFIGHPTLEIIKHNNEVEKVFKKIGFDFITSYNFKTREEVVEFYKKIDVQVGTFFNPEGAINYFVHPSRIVNAASFGIPTVLCPIEGYKEFEGAYLPARSMDEMLAILEKLKNKDYYNDISKKAHERAKRYHISEVAKLYRKLK